MTESIEVQIKHMKLHEENEKAEEKDEKSNAANRANKAIKANTANENNSDRSKSSDHESTVTDQLAEYSPHEREVVSAVIQLWNSDPSTESLGIAKLHIRIKKLNPSWTLSLNRLKVLLKSHGLQPNAPIFQYVSETTSHPNPNLVLPANIRVSSTKSRGKGLFAIKAIPAGQEIWSEEALVLIAPLDHISLMRKALACAYCARPFQSRPGHSIPGGQTSCITCSARWCSGKCKKSDLIHNPTWHQSTPRSKIQHTQWIKYEKYCVENEWQAAYSFGVILLLTLRDPTGHSNTLKPEIDSMAKVRQDIRQKAIQQIGISSFDGSSSSSLVGEQYEQLWTQGFELLKETVKSTHDLTYEEYMLGLGMVNINNLDGSIYEIQSNLNHSCEPNIDVKILTRTTGIKIVAKRDIRAGEELVTTYVNPNESLRERRHELRVGWGFICNCARCKREEKELQEALNNNLENSPVLTANRTRRKSVRFDETVQLV